MFRAGEGGKAVWREGKVVREVVADSKWENEQQKVGCSQLSQSQLKCWLGHIWLGLAHIAAGCSFGSSRQLAGATTTLASSR
jgi:hypothetical protein